MISYIQNHQGNHKKKALSLHNKGSDIDDDETGTFHCREPTSFCSDGNLAEFGISFAAFFGLFTFTKIFVVVPIKKNYLGP